MMNRTILVGRLTKDPELRYTSNGVAVAQFTLAVNRPFTNQQGEREADFIQCVVWRKQAENVANYLKKGSLAGVDGRIQTRNFEGQDGRRVYVTEIVAESVQFLDTKSDGQRSPQDSGQPSNQRSNNGNQRPPQGNGFGNQPPSGGARYENKQPPHDPFADDGQPIDISDDDLPF